jgi:hypothetical protein
MTAAAVANRLARKAFAVGVGAMILSLIAIVQTMQRRTATMKQAFAILVAG